MIMDKGSDCSITCSISILLVVIFTLCFPEEVNSQTRWRENVSIQVTNSFLKQTNEPKITRIGSVYFHEDGKRYGSPNDNDTNTMNNEESLSEHRRPLTATYDVMSAKSEYDELPFVATEDELITEETSSSVTASVFTTPQTYGSTSSETNYRCMKGLNLNCGYPPKDVFNFNCLIYDNVAMYCSWNKPDYSIDTTYTLSCNFDDMVDMPCFDPWSGGSGQPGDCNPSETFSGETWCYWNKTSQYAFMDFGDVFHFHFDVSNALGSARFEHSVARTNFIIPAPPSNVSIIPLSPKSLQVSWIVSGNIVLLGPIAQLIQYKYQGGPCTVVSAAKGFFELSSSLTDPQKKQIEVPHAFVNYSVTVFLRVRPLNISSSRLPLKKGGPCSPLPSSGLSHLPLLPGGWEEGEELWWSSSQEKTAATPPEEPEEPPVTGVGTFQRKPIESCSFQTYAESEVVVAWKALSALQFGGPGFQYCVVIVPGEQLEPQCTEVPWIELNVSNSNRTHRFEVFSVNSIGTSALNSSVEVPPLSQLPTPPDLAPVFKTQLANGTYIYHIRLHLDSEADFTVYWCRDDATECDPCQTTLNWMDVGNLKDITLTSADLELDGSENDVRFAVSSQVRGQGSVTGGQYPNTSSSGDRGNYSRNGSSGMVWSTCRPVSYSHPSLLQPPVVNLEYDMNGNVGVNWTLRCEDHAGLETLEVSFCPKNVSNPENCTDEALSSGTLNWWQRRYPLDSLEENHVYTIWIRANYTEGQGPISKPLILPLFMEPSAPQDPETWKLALFVIVVVALIAIVMTSLFLTGRAVHRCNRQSKLVINLPEALSSSMGNSFPLVDKNAQKSSRRSKSTSASGKPLDVKGGHRFSLEVPKTARDSPRSFGSRSTSFMEPHQLEGSSWIERESLSSSEGHGSRQLEAPDDLSLPTGYSVAVENLKNGTGVASRSPSEETGKMEVTQASAKTEDTKASNGYVPPDQMDSGRKNVNQAPAETEDKKASSGYVPPEQMSPVWRDVTQASAKTADTKTSSGYVSADQMGPVWKDAAKTADTKVYSGYVSADQMGPVWKDAAKTADTKASSGYVSTDQMDSGRKDVIQASSNTAERKTSSGYVSADQMGFDWSSQTQRLETDSGNTHPTLYTEGTTNTSTMFSSSIHEGVTQIQENEQEVGRCNYFSHSFVMDDEDDVAARGGGDEREDHLSPRGSGLSSGISMDGPTTRTQFVLPNKDPTAQDGAQDGAVTNYSSHVMARTSVGGGSYVSPNKFSNCAEAKATGNTNTPKINSNSPGFCQDRDTKFSGYVSRDNSMAGKGNMNTSMYTPVSSEVIQDRTNTMTGCVLRDNGIAKEGDGANCGIQNTLRDSKILVSSTSTQDNLEQNPKSLPGPCHYKSVRIGRTQSETKDIGVKVISADEVPLSSSVKEMLESSSSAKFRRSNGFIPMINDITCEI
ncbi:uncharacterized protein LOC143027158 isoform X2 [Oratosquilla oratoria]|uniref:uncharacterized protein LOC143027158 isoform X2 n=1 Tax=Oratosquilla oratoria TaxID=337810 RepID=UPI003F7681C6